MCPNDSPHLHTSDFVTLHIQQDPVETLPGRGELAEWPRRFGDYLVESELGVGGMGEVFAARRVTTEERVALKVMNRVSATALYRFKREFRVLFDVSHPNLVRLGEMGVTPDGRNFFTMELIEGVPFDEWVRGDGKSGELPDMGRLEAGFRQLHAGVQRLHAAGCIHRDLKPSNVLVTAQGRVVILDFGLIGELMPGIGVTRDGQMLGTPAYMAPEQALGRRAGPPADYYALGVMLYRCLTGELPHRGAALEVMALKQSPLELEEALRDVPAPFDSLCAALLACEPGARLTGPGVESLLNISPSAACGSAAARVFVGRERELDQLWSTYQKVAKGQHAPPIRVWGEAGQGKSALLGELQGWLEGCDCLVLNGRCREQERVPYKGVDALIDSLSAQLRCGSAEELAELRPRNPRALVRLFPVLDELWRSRMAVPKGPDELRGAGWSALRELLWALARRRPLILLIDDFQWTDVDSIDLLHEVLGRPEAPPIMVVVAVRGAAWTPAAASASQQLFAHAQELELGPLSRPQVECLVGQLAQARGLELPSALCGSWGADIYARAKGHPLAVVEMVLERELLSDLDLQGLLLRRIRALDERQRRLLLNVAVAGRIERSELLDFEPEMSARDIASLVEAGLVDAEGRQVEVLHDLLRELVLEHAGEAERASVFTRMGRHLQARGPELADAEQLFRVVDCLDRGIRELVVAGLFELEEIGSHEREELILLSCRAGEQALSMGSYSLAHDYFARARELAGPWIAALREGTKLHYQVCLNALWGQARTALTQARGDAAYVELFSWPLEPLDFGRVAVERVTQLFEQGRRVQAKQLAIDALSKLGVGLPGTAGMGWSVRQLLGGVLALASVSPQGLAELRPTTDEHARARMGLLAVLAQHSALGVEQSWVLGLGGLHARELLRNGTHEHAATGLACFARALEVWGLDQVAHRLWRGLALAEERWPMASLDRAVYRVNLDVALGPRSSPFAEVIECLRNGYEHSRVRAQRGLGVRFASACVALQLDAGIALGEVDTMLEQVLDADARGELRGGHEHALIMRSYRQVCRVLVDGIFQRSSLDELQGSPLQRCLLIGREAWVALLFGDCARTRANLARISRTENRSVRGLWIHSVHVLLACVAHADQNEQLSRAQQLLLRVRLMRWRSQLRRTARACPENYGAMLGLVEAELCIVRGDYEQALTWFERAHGYAVANGLDWVAGLALARMATHAERRMHAVLCAGARERAAEAYRHWGATALAKHMRRGQGLQTLTHH